MSLPSYDDAYERAQDRSAFSNATEADAWLDRWCHQCANDEGGGCPLVLVALMDRTPAEWQEQDRASLGSQYRCSLFSGPS